MKIHSSLVAAFGIALLSVGLSFSLPGCRKVHKAADALSFEEPMAEAAPEPEDPAPPAPQPKINDQVYVEIMARSALIWDKYKDAPADAEKAVEAVYEKFNIVHSEFQEYQRKLSPAKAAELQKSVQEFMQKIASEYR
jgi:hypothetical protein